MNKGRLEAFSDGVIAIIITIMVLELKIPHGASLTDLAPLIPVLVSYILSFIFIGIYWNNHHHLLQATSKVSGGVLWANLHLLFWLSLIPFSTAWMGENAFAPWPVALYGVVLMCSGIAYFILTRVLLSHPSNQTCLAAAIGSDFKGKVSVAIYVAGICTCALNAWIAYALYVVVAVMWLIPDRRIERVMDEKCVEEE